MSNKVTVRSVVERNHLGQVVITSSVADERLLPKLMSSVNPGLNAAGEIKISRDRLRLIAGDLSPLPRELVPAWRAWAQPA